MPPSLLARKSRQLASPWRPACIGIDLHTLFVQQKAGVWLQAAAVGPANACSARAMVQREVRLLASASLALPEPKGRKARPQVVELEARAGNPVWELGAAPTVARLDPSYLATHRPAALLALVPRAAVLFGAGALSGALAKTLTAPLDRVKVRLLLVPMPLSVFCPAAAQGQSGAALCRQPRLLTGRTRLCRSTGTLYLGAHPSCCTADPAASEGRTAGWRHRRGRKPGQPAQGVPGHWQGGGHHGILEGQPAAGEVHARVQPVQTGEAGGCCRCAQPAARCPDSTGAWPCSSACQQHVPNLGPPHPPTPTPSGPLPQVLRVVPYSAAQFYSYEVFKRWFSDEEGNLSVHRRLAAGACAGMVATLLTHPLDTLRLRLAVDPNLRGVGGTVAALLKEGKGAAFYRGLGASMLGEGAPRSGRMAAALRWLRPAPGSASALRPGPSRRHVQRRGPRAPSRSGLRPCGACPAARGGAVTCSNAFASAPTPVCRPASATLAWPRPAGIGPYMGLEMASFDLLPQSLPSFARGFCAALIATVSCYPLDTIRRHIQLQVRAGAARSRASRRTCAWGPPSGQRAACPPGARAPASAPCPDVCPRCSPLPCRPGAAWRGTPLPPPFCGTTGWAACTAASCQTRSRTCPTRVGRAPGVAAGCCSCLRLLRCRLPSAPLRRWAPTRAASAEAMPGRAAARALWPAYACRVPPAPRRRQAVGV